MAELSKPLPLLTTHPVNMKPKIFSVEPPPPSAVLLMSTYKQCFLIWASEKLFESSWQAPPATGRMSHDTQITNYQARFATRCLCLLADYLLITQNASEKRKRKRRRNLVTRKNGRMMDCLLPTRAGGHTYPPRKWRRIYWRE